MKFPSEWPKGCPPVEAINADGDVFRVVKANPPTNADFATHFETGRLPKAPPCLRCGLSVFREFRDAVHQHLLLPKLGSHVARASLRQEHGKTKPTAGSQPTHTTWWVFENVNRESLFAVVAEKG